MIKLHRSLATTTITRITQAPQVRTHISPTLHRTNTLLANSARSALPTSATSAHSFPAAPPRPSYSITPFIRPHARFYTSTPSKMSSDADYASFLDKANQDTGGASAQDTSKKISTKSVNTAVPKALEQVEEYFTSDADEPFEPVALKWDGKGEVGADDLKKLIGHNSTVESADAKQFSNYKNVVDAVKKAGNGKVSYFRVEHGGTRAEYYVVSVDEEGGKVVGLKALSVES